MLIKSQLMYAALLINMSCAAADEKIKTPANVNIEGIITFGREVSIQDYIVRGRGISIKSESCINGIFANPNGDEASKRSLDGSRIAAKGSLINYMDYYNSDPMVATISSLQNSCGNEYAIIISHLDPAK